MRERRQSSCGWRLLLFAVLIVSVVFYLVYHGGDGVMSARLLTSVSNDISHSNDHHPDHPSDTISNTSSLPRRKPSTKIGEKRTSRGKTDTIPHTTKTISSDSHGKQTVAQSGLRMSRQVGLELIRSEGELGDKSTAKLLVATENVSAQSTSKSFNEQNPLSPSLSVHELHYGGNITQAVEYDSAETFAPSYDGTLSVLTDIQKGELRCNNINVSAISTTSLNFAFETSAPLNNYKNPCWWESLETASPYKLNHYIQTERHAFMRSRWQVMTDNWQDEYKSGIRRRLRCLPYFYVAGNPKCGSRTQTGQPLTFSDYLDFFDVAADHINTGRYEDYHSIITGDGTPGYLTWSNDWPIYPGNSGMDEPSVTLADEIHKVTPGAKVIILLRNPSDRIYSMYYWTRSTNEGGSPDDFHWRALSYLHSMTKCLTNHTLRYCVYNTCQGKQHRLAHGIYHVYIRDWLKVFPREQCFFVKFEDYKNNKTGILDEVFEFLGVGPMNAASRNRLATMPRQNSRPAHQAARGDMLQETRDKLEQFFGPHNKQLTNLLQDERFLWN